MRPFSLSLFHSHSLALVPWQSVIRVGSRRFVSRHHSVRVRRRPVVRPLHHLSSAEAPLPPLKNDYGIEMKICSGIHPSPFLFGPCFLHDYLRNFSTRCS